MFFLLIFLCSPFFLHASSYFPTWLIGAWQGKTGDGTYYESWTKTDDFKLVGSAYLVKDGKNVLIETLQIETIGSHTVYIASVNDSAPVLFTLKPQRVDNEWVFENTEHDFPQRIIYTKKTPTTLVARVEGLQEGKMGSEEFVLEKK